MYRMRGEEGKESVKGMYCKAVSSFVSKTSSCNLLHGSTGALEDKNTLGLVRTTHRLVSVNGHRMGHFALAVFARIELDLGMRAATVVDSGNGFKAVVVAAELGDGGCGALFVVLGEDREDGHFGVCNRGGGGLNGGDGENEGEKGQGDGVEGGEGGHFCGYGRVGWKERRVERGLSVLVDRVCVQRCSGVMVGLRKAGKLQLEVEEWRSEERKGKEEEGKDSRNSITSISFIPFSSGQKPI